MPIKKIIPLLRKKSDIPSVSLREQQYRNLVQHWHADLYRYAYWLTKDTQIAEDLVQETCLRAWNKLDTLTDEKAIKSWLITILRRENARRFEKKQLETVEISEQIELNAPSLSEPWNWHNALSHLPNEYREPLVLQIISGFSGEEIADILDLKLNTVMTRLFRARNQLKNWFEQHPQQRGQYNG
jgi:RNA polymerase sigma-70 factor (ECF subfamily)